MGVSEHIGASGSLSMCKEAQLEKEREREREKEMELRLEGQETEASMSGREETNAVKGNGK